MFLPTVAVADDAEDAKAAMLNHYAKRNAGDAAAYVQLRHPEVEVYGNVAVVTGYTVGTITSPDGTARPIANRRTVVLIKQGGQWKIAHRHLSPVRLPQ